MGAGNEGVTGSETGAEDAELFVTLRFQPIKTTANINNCLARGGEGASNVGGNGVVGALEFAGLADVVIRLAQAKRRDAEPVEYLAESVVAVRVGVPLRHHDHCAAVWILRGKPARI